MLAVTYSRAIRVALFVCTLLVPLAIVPWTPQPLEINKQTLAILCVVVAALAWLGRSVVEKRFVLRREWLFALPMLAVLAALLSPGITSAPYLSIVGQAGQEYTSILTMAVFAVLFMLLAHEAGDPRVQRTLYTALIVGGSVLSLYVLCTMAHILPSTWPYTLIGTPNALGFYLVAITALGSGLWLSSRSGTPHDVLPSGTGGVAVKACILFTAFVTLLLALVLDYSMLWLVMLVAMGTIAAFALVRAHEFPSVGRFLLPVTLFVTALVFLFLPGMFANPFPPEVALNNGASLNIATQTLSEHRAFFGSGAGTYAFDFAQYRDPSLAATDFWDTTFDRASNHLFTVVTTLGVVGLVLHLLFFVGLGGAVIAKLARERNHEDWKMTFAPFVAWVALAVTQLAYASNFTLLFAFWLFSGLLAAQLARRVSDVNFVRSPRAGLASSFVFVLTLVVLVTTLFVTVSRYRAEIAFGNALATDANGGLLDDVITSLDTAALRNRWSDIYYRNLGHALLLKTADVMQEEDANPVFVQELIGASVNAARQATALAPGNVVNWELQGDIYREIAPLVADADVFAVASYQKAVDLAPTNPKDHVGLARAFIARADKALIAMESDDEATASAATTVRTEALEAARQSLNAALSLRSTYASAQYYLAYVLERQGKVSDAIAAMETLRQTSPLDVGVAMQLGLLYLKQGKNDAAQGEFERAIEIAPNYANAHWYLASIFEQDDDIDAAIEEVEKVLALNQGNEMVQQRLDRLKQGQAAEEIPEPVAEGDTPVVGEGATTE